MKKKKKGARTHDVGELKESTDVGDYRFAGPVPTNANAARGNQETIEDATGATNMQIKGKLK